MPLQEGLFQSSNKVTGGRYQGCILLVALVRMELGKMQGDISFGVKNPSGVPRDDVAMLVDFSA